VVAINDWAIMTSAELTALLDRLEQLEQAATPGEWETSEEDGWNETLRFIKARGSHVVTAYAWSDSSEAGDCEGVVNAPDAALIAESRNALPVLIRELRARLG
jgi:hypothetical protein